MGTDSLTSPDRVRFDLQLRGYKTEDVDRFLDRVSAASGDVDRENQWLRQANSMGRTSVQDFAMYVSGQRHLLPADVEKQKFRVSLKGYKVRQVDRYLEDVITDLRRLLLDNAELRRASGLSVCLPRERPPSNGQPGPS